jgi:hypothetical protein
MTIHRGVLIGLMIIFGAASTATAQQSSIDVKRLPLDLGKITKELRQSSETENHNGLRLRYRVDVYGEAPRIELFTKQDNLANGPVPYGAPTHREMIEHVTPIEYRAPYADLSNLLRWLKSKSDNK